MSDTTMPLPQPISNMMSPGRTSMSPTIHSCLFTDFLLNIFVILTTTGLIVSVAPSLFRHHLDK